MSDLKISESQEYVDFITKITVFISNGSNFSSFNE